MDRFGNKTHGNVTGKDTPCEYVILMDEDADRPREACMPPLPIWQNSIMMVSGQTWYQVFHPGGADTNRISSRNIDMRQNVQTFLSIDTMTRCC